MKTLFHPVIKAWDNGCVTQIFSNSWKKKKKPVKNGLRLVCFNFES